jgi:hypothetical protein
MPFCLGREKVVHGAKPINPQKKILGMLATRGIRRATKPGLLKLESDL